MSISQKHNSGSQYSWTIGNSLNVSLKLIDENFKDEKPENNEKVKTHVNPAARESKQHLKPAVCI